MLCTTVFSSTTPVERETLASQGKIIHFHFSLLPTNTTIFRLILSISSGERKDVLHYYEILL